MPTTLLIALALRSLISPAVSGRVPAWTLTGPPLERQITLTQAVGCQSPSGRGELVQVEVRLAVPENNERQRVLKLTFDPKPTSLKRDIHGNLYAVFRIPRILSGRTIKVSWKVRARLWAITHHATGAPLTALPRIPPAIRKLYLKDGALYQLRDASLQEAAREAARGAQDACDLAFKLNEFVRSRLHYLNDGQWIAAPEVLREGQGSCSEYGFLFIALCRLNGLPARLVGASALRSDGTRYEDTVHHRWSEVYLPGHGWFPVDVSRNDNEKPGLVNHFFGSTSARLLITMKGDGGKDAPLRFGYISRVLAKARGDARLVRKKQVLWERFPAAPLPLH